MTKVFTAICACTVFALAQLNTSTITGRVTDSSGAVVPNVSVSIVQKSTNINNTAVTNNEGIYRVPSLTPGEYRVSFEASGFKRSVSDVEVRTGDTLAVDAIIQLGQMTESIQVDASAPLFETEPPPLVR